MRRSLLVALVVLTSLHLAPAARAAVEYEPPRTILFSRTDGTGMHIYSVEPDGTGLTQLTFGPVEDVAPAWNADASAITYTRKTATGADTWIMDPDGSDADVFLPNARSLVWDFSGEHVAFVRSRAGNADIWLAAGDGSDRTRLTTHAARDVQPAWASLERLSFVSDRSGRDRIYAIDVDGTDLIRLTAGSGEQRRPTWGNGDLVFEQADGKDRDIVRISMPSGSVHVEVGSAADDRDPDVAIDGELVFRRVRADGSTILIHRWIGLSGRGTALTGGEVVDRDAVWAPPLAWTMAQDDQAKGNLLEAAATAQGIREDTGSFDDADVNGMTSANPSLDYVPATVESVGPEEISILPDGDTWSAAALSDSGTCYWIRLDDTVGTTYGLRSGPAGATLCSGSDAQQATDAEW